MIEVRSSLGGIYFLRNDILHLSASLMHDEMDLETGSAGILASSAFRKKTVAPSERPTLREYEPNESQFAPMELRSNSGARSIERSLLSSLHVLCRVLRFMTPAPALFSAT